MKSFPDVSTAIEIDKSYMNILRDTFAVTLLNPQAIIDDFLLLRGYHAYIPDGMGKCFILVFWTTSFLWFLVLD